jgi:DMSO/TMAO reductase YedYZ heme-binding membrane subunit
MVSVIASSHGVGEEGARIVLRATARTSLAFFLGAFLASSLRRLARTDLTAWLRRNRRQLGVSFAVSHLVHGWAIVVLTRITGREVDTVTLIVGGLGYLVLALLAATSFDRTAAWLGPDAWRRLHTTGVWYLWFVFVATYFGTASRDPVAAASLGLLLAAATVRVMVRRPALT